MPPDSKCANQRGLVHGRAAPVVDEQGRVLHALEVLIGEHVGCVRVQRRVHGHEIGPFEEFEQARHRLDIGAVISSSAT